jgi:hypothetical protein
MVAPVSPLLSSRYAGDGRFATLRFSKCRPLPVSIYAAVMNNTRDGWKESRCHCAF